MKSLRMHRFGRLALSLLLAVLLLVSAVMALAAGPVRAAGPNCTVKSSGGDYTAIQPAINDADCTTITVDSGTYNENLTINRSLTLQGAGQTSTTIDGNGVSRVMTITGASTEVYLYELQITGGDATTAPTPRFGGGIFVTGGAILRGENLRIDNNLASSTTSGFGGGVAVDSGSAYLTSTLIYSNTANRRAGILTGSGRGGGLYVNNGSLHLVTSQVLTNLAAFRAGSGDTASGGGLHVNQDTTVYLSGNRWQGNIARGSNSEPCDLSACAGGLNHEGGGAVSASFPTGAAVITITNDNFIGNIANDVDATVGNNSGRGGGISLHTTNTGGRITATLSAVTMTQNVAATKSNGSGEEGRGGAIYARHTTLSVKRANIYENQAAASNEGSGGGIYIREPLAGDSLDVINSVLAGNTASGTDKGAQLHIDFTNLEANNIVRIVHATIADDTLNPNQGIHYNSPDASDELLITNTIVASHAVGIANVNATGKATARYMLFYGNTDNHPSPGTTAFPDMTGWVTGDPDPRFVNPAENDYHLREGSPAIDQGVNANVTNDIDGDTRPQGNGFDIGADEYTEPVNMIYLPIVIK